MFLLVLAHPSCLRQNPDIRKMVVGVCVYSCIYIAVDTLQVKDAVVTTIFTSAEEGGYVFGSVCLSVCLFVCLSIGLLANL